ncbi:MAG: hypothetical protein RQ885_07825 [Desulfurococcales archaeon]|jgi:beta-ribofuranosylaminobenzene 5'-phosphate synthase|nr:hypothetical protein [Desulfurococcales archaeon]
MRCVTRSVSRIHITLIDLSGSFGRLDGGAGITLETPRHVVYAEAFEGKPSIEVKGDIEDVVERCARAVLKEICRTCGARVEVTEVYDLHVGLGGVTQLCLATARSIAMSLGLDIDVYELAKITGRGGTSGIGVYAFKSGGFIVDGGHKYPGEKSSIGPSDYVRAPPPPLISRLEIPRDWEFILIIPRGSRRIYGELEKRIFQEGLSIPLEEVWRLSHILLLGVMPSIASGDIDLFRRSIKAIQDIGFKKIEWRYQEENTWIIRRGLEELGIRYGMSSMGPTIYIPCNRGECIEIREKIEKWIDNKAEVMISRGRNSGAESLCY